MENVENETVEFSKPPVYFENITFSDGTMIDLSANGIIVFVGPNNAGKSVALGDLELLLGKRKEDGRGLVIQSASPKKTIEFEEFIDLMKNGLRVSQGEAVGRELIVGPGYHNQISSIRSHWLSNELGFLSGFVYVRIKTEDRISYCNNQPSLDLVDGIPTHPLQALFMDKSLNKKTSDLFKKTFGQELIAIPAGGPEWSLLVGTAPKKSDGEDVCDPSYINKLRSQTTPLSEQGDGMRCFVSVILKMIVNQSSSIFLLDEPEAFLHPPQARRLGEFLMKEKPLNSQLFIATHSQDLLAGILNAGPKNLQIIRMKREGEKNKVKKLDEDLAQKAMKDPILKFSSVMSGAFHRRVIVCEAESDCLFYSSLLDLPIVHGEQYPDVLFVHSNGKQGIERLAKILRSLDVDVDVIVDIDVLNDLNVFQKLVVEIGGEWDRIEVLAKRVKQSIESQKKPLKLKEVKERVLNVFSNIPDENDFSSENKIQIEDILREPALWSGVKKSGENCIPKGDATKWWKDLKNICSEFGLWIVPVGEVEGFYRSIGGHGPKWVQNVLENCDLTLDVDLQEARNFVKQIWERIPS